MAKSTEPRPGEGRFDTLVRLLGSKDPQTRQEAAAMLRQVGKPVAPPLVIEAIKPGKRPQHRIAILDVVQQIGGPLGPDDMFRLQDLLRHRDPAVCRKAEQVIMSMAPGGMPKTDAELAMARTLNPFLRPPPNRRALRADPDFARWRAEFNAARRKERERDQGRMS
jgi:hypothetical protein